MRQRITIEQLQQLSPEQQERLREWWEPTEGDCFVLLDTRDKNVYGELTENKELQRPQFFGSHEEEGTVCDILFSRTHEYGIVTPESNCLPLLSIGQCIELLMSKPIWEADELCPVVYLTKPTIIAIDWHDQE